MRRCEAIVTAGGTIEPIDDVRVITNISTGRFGHAIAGELSSQGVRTTLLCPDDTVERLGLPPGVSHEPFTSADSLNELLLGGDAQPDIVFHAAAVSDYTPERAAGKIRSDREELTITLVRTPKIIAGLRSRYGPAALLVGFKLLSGVPEAELRTVAAELLESNRLDMVVANDMQRLQDDRHPVDVVTAEGKVLPIDGDRRQVAGQLVETVLHRAIRGS